ncbi:MAG: hypothetical protein HC793_01320, partial [Aquincola sp.]|nr:hypothetical protein [Aquincola sp.]
MGGKPMTEPVLVIHGVNTHDLAPFLAQVQKLQNVVGTSRTLIPVHWGDLGGQSRDLPDCLPVYTDSRWRVRADSGEMEAKPLPSAQVRAFLGSPGKGLANEVRAALVTG